MRNRRGSCHLTEIWTIAIHPLTLQDYVVATYFSAIRNDISGTFERVQKGFVGLRFPPIFRTVTNVGVHGGDRSASQAKLCSVRACPPAYKLYVNQGDTMRTTYDVFVTRCLLY